MADTTFPGLARHGTHAARPAATAVATGTLYGCDTHNLVYQSDGAAWGTWLTASGSYTDPLTTRGDIPVRNNAGATTRLPIGAANTVLHGSATDPSYSAVLPADLDVSADNTTADATTGHHGLLPKLGGGTTNFLRADGTWNAPGGGGGVTYGEQYSYPTSFSGDSDAMTATTNWTDVTAFTVKQIVNSTMLNLESSASGATDHRVRFTLGTTKAGAFDFRWWGILPYFQHWSADLDTYLEILAATSGGTVISIVRIYARSISGNSYRKGIRVGTTAVVTTNTDPALDSGAAFNIRMSRDGSNVLKFEWGMGQAPPALHPFLAQADNTVYAPSSSGTVARIELSIHRPSGPTAGQHVAGVLIDAFESL